MVLTKRRMWRKRRNHTKWVKLRLLHLEIPITFSVFENMLSSKVNQREFSQRWGSLLIPHAQSAKKLQTAKS